MANEDDDQLQQITKLSESTTAALSAMQRSLENFNAKAKATSTVGGGLNMMNATLGSMGRTLLGGSLAGIGVVAAMRELGNATDGVATRSVLLQNFAREMRTSADNVGQLRQGFSRLGIDSAEADRNIAGLMNKLKSLHTYREASPEFQTLNKSPGGAAQANRLLSLMDAGKWDEARNEVIAGYGRQDNGRSRQHYANIWDMPETTFENLPKAMQRNLQSAVQVNEKAAKEFHDRWVDTGVRLNDVWTSMSNSAMENSNKIGDAFGNIGVTSQNVVGSLGWAASALFGKVGRSVDEFKSLTEALKNLSTGRDDASSSIYNYSSGGGGLDPKYNYRDYPQADDPMGEDYSRRPFYSKEYWYRRSGGGTSGATDFSGMRRSVEVQEDSNASLREIRDSLLRIETGSTVASSYGTGIRSPGGAAQAGLGGFRPNRDRSGEGGSSSGNDIGRIMRGATGGAGTRADRNNNPGNIEYGDFAKRMGATGSDGRFAIFPDRETGFKAAESLLGGKGYEGLNLGEIGRRWANGDARWAANVSKATGIPLDTVPNAAQRSQIARTGMPRAEGSALSPGYTGGNGDGLPSAVLDEARKVAASGGADAVQSYIRSQGYQVNSAWCGDFAAAVVRGSGGTPPKGHSVASNWRNYGRQVDNPEPGDIAVRRGVPTGSTGSHVTIVDQVEGNRFYGIGGNQSRRRANFPTSGFDYFRGEDAEAAARKRMDDKAKANNSAFNGQLNGKIEFLNVPPNVKTSMEGNEIFKDLSITRSRQSGIPDDAPGRYGAY